MHLPLRYTQGHRRAQSVILSWFKAIGIQRVTWLHLAHVGRFVRGKCLCLPKTLKKRGISNLAENAHKSGVLIESTV